MQSTRIHVLMGRGPQCMSVPQLKICHRTRPLAKHILSAPTMPLVGFFPHSLGRAGWGRKRLLQHRHHFTRMESRSFVSECFGFMFNVVRLQCNCSMSLCLLPGRLKYGLLKALSKRTHASATFTCGRGALADGPTKRNPHRPTASTGECSKD